MNEAWKALTLAGLPDGAPRTSPTAVDLAAVRSALASIDVDALDEVERVVLLAWLEAFKHHWPTCFQRELGEREALIAALRRQEVDANRYIKLRRIAAENLAGIL